MGKKQRPPPSRESGGSGWQLGAAGACAVVVVLLAAQQGGTPSSSAAAEISRPEFEKGPAQAMESLYVLATAAEKCGDRGQLEAANRQIIASAGRHPTGFRGVPNAWAGLASMYAQRGEPGQALAAVEAGVKAAGKLRPKHTERPTDEMSKRHVVVLGSALPELIAVKGLATAALAAGGPQDAVEAAQQVYRSAVQTDFKPWPRPGSFLPSPAGACFVCVLS